MLRETKLGIVVSCSFLGLLGTVVTNKMREKPVASAVAPAAEPETRIAAVTSPPNKTDSLSEAKPSNDKPTPANLAPAIRDDPALKTATYLPSDPPQDRKEEKKEKKERKAPAAPAEESLAGPPPIEPPESEKKPGDVTDTSVAIKKIIPQKDKHSDDNKPPKTTAPLTGGEPQEPMGGEGPPMTAPPTGVEGEKKTGQEKKAELDPLAALPGLPMGSPIPAVEPAKDKEEKKDDKKDEKKERHEGGPPPGPPAPLPTEAVNALSTEPTAVPVDPSQQKKPAPFVAPSPESVGVKVAESSAPPPAGMGDTSKPPVVGPVGGPPAVEPLPTLVPTPVPMLEKKAEPAPMPPVVARTPVLTPLPGSGLPVESHREEDYSIKPGDSFAGISKARYNSEGYANALKRYNEDDRLRNVPLREKDGLLEPGQVISIPDLAFLEKRYADLMPKTPAPLPKTETPSPPGLEGKLTPVPAAPDTTIRTVAAASGVRYSVPQGGQTMREIARLTLGDGERWIEIVRLNPAVRPEYVVPAGTVLVLPTDAKIPFAPGATSDQPPEPGSSR